MAINSATVTKSVVEIKSPNGTIFSVDAVTYNSGNGQATFTFSRTFTNADNGTWEVFSSTTDKVLDGAGNAAPGGVKLGSFTVNIPAVVGDTTPPTVTLVSVTPTSVTAAGNATISIVVAYADA